MDVKGAKALAERLAQEDDFLTLPEVVIVPTTGEVLGTRAELVQALREIEERMAPLYEQRRAVRHAIGSRFEPTLPERRRDRTAKQDAVTRCPRCGDRLPDEEEPEVTQTKWKWATVSGLPLTLTLDSDDPDQIAMVERSAADNFISLTRVEDEPKEETDGNTEGE